MAKEAPGAALVWFRLDLRLTDHSALTAAAALGKPVVPVYIWSPEEDGAWPPGAASRVWLHESLSRLDAALRAIGSRLILRRGERLAVLRALAEETGAGAVYWTRCHAPASVAQDTAIKAALRASGIEAKSFGGALLVEPHGFGTRDGKPYQVFTPFWKTAAAAPVPEPLPAPGGLAAPASWPESIALDDLGLRPRIPWDAGIRSFWTPGEEGAQARLNAFLEEDLAHYQEHRDLPGGPGVSCLSPHLHFGEISPATVLHQVQSHAAGAGTPAEAGAAAYLRQLYWREFAHHLLYHFPETPGAPLRENFRRFPWREDRGHLEAWQRGMTGYPMVDAGMRQLWETGWMHNRVRMIAASFLVKHLLISWEAGARWFWDTLVDADLANNTLGWQWTAGCGADAAPYFRIFNPVLQGAKFDPEGDYVRRWVPEIAGLPDEWLHRPWAAPAEELRAAGVTLGEDYPAPIVDHAFARDRALAAYAEVKR